jgi:phage terminase large subunit-like protein
VLPAFFVPKDSIRERGDAIGCPTSSGCARVSDGDTGNVVDYEAVRQQLKDWAAEFDVRQIAFDPWNATIS